jgi:hypothetical protein
MRSFFGKCARGNGWVWNGSTQRCARGNSTDSQFKLISDCSLKRGWFQKFLQFGYPYPRYTGENSLLPESCHHSFESRSVAMLTRSRRCCRLAPRYKGRNWGTAENLYYMGGCKITLAYNVSHRTNRAYAIITLA